MQLGGQPALCRLCPGGGISLHLSKGRGTCMASDLGNQEFQPTTLRGNGL